MMVSSNWDILQKELKATNSSGGTTKREKNKTKRENMGLGGLRGQQAYDLNQAVAEAKRTVIVDERHESKKRACIEKGGTVLGNMVTTSMVLSDEEKHRYIAIDCEMVGVGNLGKESVLARCCIVNWDGEVVYDRYIRPIEFVTDFRTSISGIESKHLRKAIKLEECQRAVVVLIADKIVVGHSLKNDLTALLLTHPHHMIRDTATYKPLKVAHGKKLRPRSLKSLSKEFLGREIQKDKHDPGEDARAAMDLYKLFRKQWEHSLMHHRGGKSRR